jgi:glycine cleavage system H protein
MNIPDELKYTKSHEWVRIDGDEITVGITDFAQNQLTALTFVELPEEGQEVEAGEELVVVESVKQASDVYAVASGTITAVNSELEKEPEQVNNDPYGAGWIYKLKLNDPSSLGDLLDPAGYGELAPNEG